MRIRLIKWIDNSLGRLVAGMLPAAQAREIANPRRFLLIRPGGIGDAVLLIPAILALKAKFPKAEISVLAERRNASAFSFCAAVDHLLLYDNPFHLFKLLRGGYHVVIDTEQWHRLSAVVGRFLGSAMFVGFASNERKRLFTCQVDYSQDRYEADSFFDLLAPLDIHRPDPQAIPFLTLSEQAVRRAQELLAPLQGAPFVAIFPGASIADKRWGAERFQQVASLINAANMPVVVLGAGEDQAAASIILRGNRGLDLAGKTNLGESAALIARSALLLSGDSGILHIAVGLATPTVSLFGAGNPLKWGPRGERHTVLRKGLFCSPCTRFGTMPACTMGVRCLSEITPQEVARAVASLTAVTAPLV